jgi:cytoskeletal protein RodZ
MQAKRRNRISFVKVRSLVTIASLCLILMGGMSISSPISSSNAQLGNTSSEISSPARPPTPNKSSDTTITSNSNSIYSIPSTFVKVDRFTTNYTIAGEISSIDASKELITSTIVNDFDKNPNIGYVVNSSISLNVPSQPRLPNPFVSTDTINQKITNKIQDVIAASASANPIGKNVQIKCNFGMILANYKCS